MLEPTAEAAVDSPAPAIPPAPEPETATPAINGQNTAAAVNGHAAKPAPAPAAPSSAPAPGASASGQPQGRPAYVPAAAMPTQEGPHGARYDFNEGCRVMLPETGKPWRVRISDLDTGNILYRLGLACGQR